MILEHLPADSPLKTHLIPSDLPQQRWYRSFLTYCLLQKVVTPDDFSSLIHNLPVGESLFLMFAWFAPYIELFTPGDLDTLLGLARSSPDLTEEAAEFVGRFDEMRNHEWRLHKEYFQAGYFHISLAAFLRKDDIV
jgi:hypothetical protein